MLRPLARRLVPYKFRPTSFLKTRITLESNEHVLCGPFRGMHYISTNFGSVYYPMILGIYESEVAHLIIEVASSGYDFALVLSATEGYYAVGLSVLNQKWNVAAFEANPKAQWSIAELAQLNDVRDRIDIYELLDIGRFRDSLSIAHRPFVLMDIEGGEAFALDPKIVPDLRRASILVEIHEYAIPGVRDVIINRFSGTHDSVEILARDRRADDFPIRVELAKKPFYAGAVIQIMSEQRQFGMSWLWLMLRIAGSKDLSI